MISVLQSSKLMHFLYCALALFSGVVLSACNRSDQLSKASSAIAGSAPILTIPAIPNANTLSPVAKAAQERIDTPQKPLTAMAELGKKIFNDSSLSASGKLSCASCHSPEHAYAPGNNLAVQLGGTGMQQQGGRAVPSLTYHDYAPPFSIGPDLKPDEGDKAEELKEKEAFDAVHAPSAIQAKASLSKANAAVQENVPQGGFDWDGRAQTLMDQAGGPLLASNEMANKGAQTLLNKFKNSAYSRDFIQLFGDGVFTSPNIALGEAYFALARFQLEDRSFHPYDSKYDYYLAERVTLTAQEERGLKLFQDPKKGNCASCHLEKSTQNGLKPPAFTDYQFEALAAPRNAKIEANRDPKYFDLGMCGPLRTDAIKMKNYCGFFKTPSLRNTATRQVFFHNGVFKSLDEVMHFYVERETKPEKWYPTINGKVMKYNDIPVEKHANVDVTDAPFDRKLGDQPALNEDEIQDIIVFLKTLTDGYKPGK